MPMIVPDRSEAAEYYFTYIDQVPAGDICATLDAQTPAILALFDGISDERSLQRYAPDKWSIRQVVAHLSDTERVFTFRALWFARGLAEPLPSFDHDAAVPASCADDRSWRGLVDEFRAVRAATAALFRGLPAEAWTRRGTASGKSVSVRALAYITVGHAAHHTKIVRERYL